MEFRKCPACQVSVLDDDAEECPFCGASMSGKPTSAPKAKPAESPKAKPPAAPQAPAGGTAKSAAKTATAVAKKAAAKPEADDDDPFDIDTSAVSRAPSVSPKPAKGKMVRVVCPMCETPGFIPAKLQGRDVKCCNPDCMVPVFKAPLPERGEDDDQTKSKGGLSRNQLIAATVVGVGVVIGGLWWIQQGGSASPESVDNASEGNGGQTDPTDVRNLIADPELDTGPERLPLEEIRTKALEQIVSQSQSRDQNRSTAYCRRLAAEAYALAGDMKEARQQLKQLQRVGSRVPFYQVEPLVLILWQELAGSDRDAARKTFEEAVTARKGMPRSGRTSLDAAASLAAAQLTFNEVEAAKSTLSGMEADAARARVAAVAQLVFDLQSYDIDQMLRMSSLDMTADPLAVSTAVRAAVHGQWEAAIAWAQGAGDVAVTEDCLAALATSAARRSLVNGQSALLVLVQSLLDELSPAGRSRIHAGIATAHLMQGDTAGAEAALQQALAAFEAATPPPTVPTPDVRAIYNSQNKRRAGLPDPAPMRSAALAVAQMARLQFLLGHHDEAWATLLKGWEHTRGMGPAYRPLKRLQDQIDDNPSRAQQRVGRELRKTDRDEIFGAYRVYRRQLAEFYGAADDRFHLELALLQEAISWGLLKEVGQFIQDPAAVVADAADQPYLEAPIVSVLKLYAAAAGPELSELVSALPKHQVDIDPAAKLTVDTEVLFQKGKYREAAARLGRVHGDLDQVRDLRAMQLACRLVNQQKPAELIEFVQSLHDPVLGEDCLELAGALSVGHELAPDLWNLFQQEKLEPTEKVALLRGFVDGIRAREQAQHAAGEIGPDAETAANSP